MASILGYDSPEDLVNRVTDIRAQVYVDPEARDRLHHRLLEPGDRDEQEVQVKRKDGSVIWVAESTRLVRDDFGRVEFYEGFLTDITERRHSQERIQAQLAEKEVLLREIHHRVKNNLQVVSSMLSIQSAFLEDERSIAYFQDARTRIQSMALVHEHLYQSPTLSRVEMKSYVDELVSTVVNSMDVSQTGIRVVTDVGEMTTDVDNAIPLGMLINELLSNALKYAYPNRQGEIRVFLGNHDAALVLEVADHGIGLSEDRRLQQESLGLRLVQALGEQLGAAVDYIDNKPGLRVYVRAPLTQS
jgi:PAS domain S-box-containing protein